MAPRILIVDVDRRMSAATTQLLASAGYETTHLSSFEAASRSIAAHRPDLLLTAVRLGRFNGLHLALRARADYPDLPIVVVGGPSDQMLAGEATKFGVRFMQQSADSGPLLALIAELLNGDLRP